MPKVCATQRTRLVVDGQGILSTVERLGVTVYGKRRGGHTTEQLLYQEKKVESENDCTFEPYSTDMNFWNDEHYFLHYVLP